MKAVAGVVTRAPVHVVDEVCSHLYPSPTQSQQLETAFWTEQAQKSSEFEAVFQLFKTNYPELFQAPSITPVFGDVATNVDVMLWLREKFAAGSSILISQGEMPDAPVVNGKRNKAAPCWPLDEIIQGLSKVNPSYFGGYYVTNVFHQTVIDRHWKHPAFIGSCTRNLKTRWHPYATYFVWVDLETCEGDKRVPPAHAERAALVNYCRERGAAVVSMSPNGLHVLLIFTQPVSVTTTKPMKAAVQWFFRDFPQLPASRWKLDLVASATRSRLERACPVIYWDKDATVTLPPEVLAVTPAAPPAPVPKFVTSKRINSASEFGSSGKSAVAGRKALGLRREALHFCGVEHVNSHAFTAQVAATVGISYSELAEFFRKHPVASESFGPLAVAVTGREVLTEAQEWCRQRTKKLYASLAWVYTIIFSRTACTPQELFNLFSGLLIRPLVSPDTLVPPQGPPLPSHILMPNHRPCQLYEQAVLAAFGVTKDSLNQVSNSQAVKARAALDIAKADPKYEDQLCNLLDRASALMINENFLEWLKTDIDRCANKYWRGPQRLASKRRIRMVLQAISHLANPENFSTSELVALVKGKICDHGYKKLTEAQRTAQTDMEKPRRKIKVKTPRKKNLTQAVNRALIQLQLDGLLARHNQLIKNKNTVGRGAARWGVTTLAAESAKWVKPNKTESFAEAKKCFKHNSVRSEGVVSSLSVLSNQKRGARSVVLKPISVLDQWGVGALNHGKGICAERIHMLVYAVRGYKAAGSGTMMWQFEGFTSTHQFSWTKERFAGDMLEAGWVKVRDVHIAQFACPPLLVADESGHQRELGPVDTYAGPFFALEIDLKINREYSKAWLQAKPSTYDESNGQFASADAVQIQPAVRPDLYQLAVVSWVKKQTYLSEIQAEHQEIFAKVAASVLAARAEPSASVQQRLENEAVETLGLWFDNIPTGIIRWAAYNWQPGAEKSTIGHLLRRLQIIYRHQSSGTNN